MTDIQSGFSKSYAEARQKFLKAAQAAGLTVDSNIHPLKGRDGEELAMDVVLDGAPDAKQLLIISSACHGVEGYCGSGVQVFALHDAEWRAKADARFAAADKDGDGRLTPREFAATAPKPVVKKPACKC